ncbi:hypothetical protein [Amycolatopsis sp. CA-126428]|jgi:hypothetical protein|uniref:hypothetical protein n=1 Tax=Amycolatopsis sp. CA-126428 TaxID=2073158 RepID=UPI0011B05E31|nr:hypothetical protein [Amycolatopsis sp. CA-126428]
MLESGRKECDANRPDFHFERGRGARVVNVYCRILTLVKSVFAAFVVGAVAGFAVAAGNATEPAAPTFHGSAPLSASAWVQR